VLFCRVELELSEDCGRFCQNPELHYRPFERYLDKLLFTSNVLP
jgi:hypothetical protein